MSKIGVWQHVNTLPQGTFNPDFAKVLNKGFEGIIEEIDERLQELPLWSMEDVKKRCFLNAVKTCLHATIRYSRRYAALAREMAQKESDPKRKKELETIAENCEWVPAKPARTYWEAIQTIWWVTVGSWIDGGPVSITPGRMNTYLYQFYKRDKNDGKITQEEAIELMECFFLKILEGGLFVAEAQYRTNQGQTAHVISLGGTTEDGEDGTNEIDWILLETQRRLRVVQPSLSLFYHNKMSQDFLVKALEVVRETGLGQPAFFNNDVAIQRHLQQYDVPLKEARVCAHAGCIQTVIPGKTAGGWEGNFHMPKMLELALNNGKDPLTAVQIGPQTGNPETFQSYEELHEAVKKQVEYFQPMLREFDQLSESIQADIFPTPFQSAFVDDCIALGKDITEGGVRYSCLGNEVVGTIDMANSLATIKKLVFEDKKITMGKLKDALGANFEGDGYEDIQRMCLDAPKYGNDDDYVDQIAKQWYTIWADVHESIPNFVGKKSVSQAWSLTSHFNAGRLCGALPSGRKARVPFADGTVSAMPGTDVNGPTALVKSAVKPVDTVRYNSNHFNMKFHPSALEGRGGLIKLLALIKTYMDLGGSHVQFNCVSGKVLIDAQRHPEKYRDLVVRVAGFSAFFIHLDKEVQEEVMKRTELKFD